MKLNKLLVLTSAFACALTLASCGKKEVKGYVGLGHAASYAYTAATETAAQKGQIDATAAMVVFDKNGKVLENRIDVVQVKFGAQADDQGNYGLVISNLADGDVKTKLELGKDYNMKRASALGAEVDAQIEAFADWTIGKTMAEIEAATELKEHNGEQTPYLKEGVASCTIAVGDFIEAMKCAWNLKDAEEVKLPEKYSVGVNFKSGLYYSNKNEVTIDMGGVVMADGKVVAAQIDALDLQFNTSASAIALKDSKYVKKEGETIVDIAVSKKELGAAYAMKPTSELEWFEHADIIEHLVVGKNADGIKAIKADEWKAAKATITVTAYVEALSSAAKYADMEHVGPQA